ncbi:hypothetical protein ABT352_11435 [Streptosporangium sp. NPDC000563]|uniref:effector-associated constant component EACC1 n=1 Tax=Streptosporangium sp. NPDC000563 TaxID=3154366 RepID=UPI00331EB7C4
MPAWNAGIWTEWTSDLEAPMPEPISPQEPETPVDAAEAPFEVVLTVSEPADVGPLFRRLSTIPDVIVTRRRSGPDDGKLGVTEVLQLLVPSSAVLAVAIRTLPVFIRSRRSSVTVTATRGDRSVTVTGENLDDPQKVLEITDRLLRDD